jgi:hypothetical protein
MSEQQERLKHIREHVNDAHDELHALDEAERKPYQSELKRLDEVIAYAAVVLDATDAELLSTNAFQAIRTAASNISNHALSALQNAESYGDGLLDAIALLPVARGREVEQQVKEAAANFQRAAKQRLRAFEEDVKKARKELADLSPTIDARSAEIKAVIENETKVFEAKLADFETAIATHQQALDEQLTRQSQAFTEAQEERAGGFQEVVERAQGQLHQIHQQAQDEVEAHVAEIRRMEEDSARLVGAIGLAGTAERYSEEARDQNKTANTFRWLAVLVALGAVAMAVIASLHHDQTTQSLTAKLAVSALLGGLSAYLARQSGRHRRREEHARSLQLELTAFSPFIEPLSSEQQEEERVIMTRKTFGKTTAPGASEEEPGPAPLSFLLQRRRKQLEAETDDEDAA